MCNSGNVYASFIPFAKVVDPYGDAIIAWEMNDTDLPRDHGYPCRLLSPGNAGFRNVKWVEEISVTQDSIGDGCDQKNQHFGPEVSFRGHYVPGKSGEGPTPDLKDVSAPRVCTEQSVRAWELTGMCGKGRGVRFTWWRTVWD